jgi:hypothetical protein
MTTSRSAPSTTPAPSPGIRTSSTSPSIRSGRLGDMQLAYLSNGTAKIEILGGSAAEPHGPAWRGKSPGVVGLPK